VNGIRALATTGIRQEDSGITLGGVNLVAPFHIEAIGDPAALRAALAVRGGFVEGLRAVGLRVAVQGPRPIRVPARVGVGGFRHARPAASP
jgi:uncharacterized protein YlxW (UPF0749 family)